VIAPRVQPPKTPSSDPIQASPLALQPDTLDAFLRLYGVLWSRGVVDQPTKEVARIRNARRIDCPICKAIRCAGARQAGLTEDVVDRIRDDWSLRELAPRHQAALRAVDAFHDAAGALDTDSRHEISRELTPEEIAELGAGIALFMGFSKIAVALGGLPDKIPVHEQPTPTVPE
jgi:alkylhydroperoxidase family enzyme